MDTPTQPVDRAAGEEPAPSRFIQCRVPSALYEGMRLQGFLTRRSMNSIALAAVAAYRAEVEAGRIVPERGAPERGEIVKFNLRVGDDLHEWLRTTAFYARTSINALGVAALALAHAAQAVSPASIAVTTGA